MAPGMGDGLRGLTLGGWPRIAAGSFGKRAALVGVETGAFYTYQDVAAIVEERADALRACGVHPGDRVAYRLERSVEAALTLYAINAAGGVWVPCNLRLGVAELLPQLEPAGVYAMVHDAASAGVASKVAAQLSEKPRMLCWGHEAFAAPTQTVGVSVPARVTDIAPAGMLHTSGTTGRPKAAVHTHRSWLGWTTSLVMSLGWRGNDRILNPYPMFHMGGTAFTAAGLEVGATVYLLDHFDPTVFLDTVNRERITATVLVPTMVQQILALPVEHLAAAPGRSLRQITTTSAPLLQETQAKMRKQWPQADLYTMYSATEALYSVLLPMEQGERPRSVGRSAWGMEIAVMDDTGHILPPGEPGLIYARGVSVYTGYWENPAANQAACRGEWFTSEDVGYLDGDGYLYILDRKGDMIHTGGERVASVEVEDRLLTHPGVAEVAVIGVPDALWGERVHAVVVPKAEAQLSAESLTLWCRETLAGFKCPKTVAFVHELPKGPTGKLLKRALRAAYAEPRESKP